MNRTRVVFLMLIGLSLPGVTHASGGEPETGFCPLRTPALAPQFASLAQSLLFMQNVPENGDELPVLSPEELAASLAGGEWRMRIGVLEGNELPRDEGISPEVLIFKRQGNELNVVYKEGDREQADGSKIVFDPRARAGFRLHWKDSKGVEHQVDPIPDGKNKLLFDCGVDPKTGQRFVWEFFLDDNLSLDYIEIRGYDAAGKLQTRFEAGRPQEHRRQ